MTTIATKGEIKIHIKHGGNRKPVESCEYCRKLKVWKANNRRGE